MSVYVYDPKDRTEAFFKLDHLFAKGVIVGGEIGVNTKCFGLPGEHHIGALRKHVDLIDLRFDAERQASTLAQRPPNNRTKPDSYTIYYGSDQYLQIYLNEPKRGRGLFGRASISDGNPTPSRYFLSAGVGGESNLRCGRGDTFGIGWYFIGTGNDFGPIPRAALDPQNGTGVEMFYSIPVTPWLNVAPEIQFIRPGLRAIANDAVVYGLRAMMRL